ncbi:MAG: TetR/AcrR family transcriptional regulator [Rhodospirillales bacterium]|nr:TetR/AcrR family transcriptional regulator [Rhodospirillales bacterium]
MSSGNPETRQRILDAAWRALESGDAKKTRMGDIAKLAGVSRQALYLHFPARTDLLVAVTQYIDRIKDVDGRLEKSRNASSGGERLDAFIEAWGDYIPEIAGVARALLDMRVGDPDAGMAWDDRMRAVRHGCDAAVKALKKDGDLSNDHTQAQATDVLWMLLSFENWERLRFGCGWPQKKYVTEMKAMARRLLTD